MAGVPVTTPLPGPQLPWPKNRRPLSIVSFSNSVGSLQIPVRSDPGEGTYVEVMADVLAGHGVPAVAHLESRWFDFLHRAMRQYPERVRAHTPDVVVIQFGLNEYQPWLAPVWLIRHLLVEGEAVTRPALWYRRVVATRLWRLMRGYRRRAAPLVGTRTWQTTPRRFEGHLRRLLFLTRYGFRPLVLVLDLDVPGPKLQHFLPGLDRRHAVFQDVFERVVKDCDDPTVRLVRVSEITAALGPEAMLDSMHYTPQTHRAVGEVLAAEVVDWLRERGSR